MFTIDENLTKTKAFKEQMDQHAEILFGDGTEAPRDRKSLRARLIEMRAAIGKILHQQTGTIRHQQSNLPTVE